MNSHFLFSNKVKQKYIQNISILPHTCLLMRLSILHSEHGLGLWSSPDDPLLPVLDDGLQQASSPVVVIITVVLFGTFIF